MLETDRPHKDDLDRSRFTARLVGAAEHARPSEVAAQRAPDQVDDRRLAAIAPIARTHRGAAADGSRLDRLDGRQMVLPDVDLVPLALERLRDALLVAVDVAERAHLAVVAHPRC